MIKRNRLYDNGKRCKLNLRMEGANNGTTWTDSSSYNRTVSRYAPTGTTVTSTTQKKFGSSSYYNDNATSNHISVPASTDWTFATHSYSFSAWVYKIDTTNSCIIISHGNWGTANAATAMMWVTSVWNTAHYVSANGSTSEGISANCGMSTNTWFHIVAGRTKGGYAKIYINGILTTSNTTANVNVYTTSYKLQVGSRDIAGNPWNNAMVGYLDQAMVHIGMDISFNRNFKPPNRAA